MEIRLVNAFPAIVKHIRPVLAIPVPFPSASGKEEDCELLYQSHPDKSGCNANSIRDDKVVVEMVKSC